MTSTTGRGDRGGTGRHSAGSGHWWRIAIGGGGGMFVAMGIGRFSYTAMVPALVGAGQLTPIEAGRVGTINFVGFFVGAAGSVSAGAWLSRRALLMLAVLVAVAGLAASAVVDGFAALALCRGAVGVATGVIMVNSLALIAETAPAAHRAMAGSFVFAGVGLGILASGVLVPALLAGGLALTWWSLAIAGGFGAALAIWGWIVAPSPPYRPVEGGAVGEEAAEWPFAAWSMRGLLLAHFLFSVGIVPHSIYWVDYIVRELGLGFASGGLHWSIVGVFAFLGPLLYAGLAQRFGTAPALVLAFLLLGAGLAAPTLWPHTISLIASSVLFGAQPGVSALMAARARDLGRPEAMGRVMRAMILANALGAVVGGALVPVLYASFGTQAPLFVIGAAAMGLAAVAALPRWHRAVVAPRG